MKMLTVLEEAFAFIRRKGGFYSQVPLYARGEEVYAKVGSTFLKLRENGTTSNPDTRVIEIDPGQHTIVLHKDKVPYFVATSLADQIQVAAE